jgi:predicted alpha/beta-fold hydrolase
MDLKSSQIAFLFYTENRLPDMRDFTMIIESSFQPAWWLKNEHAQTIYPTIMFHEKTLISCYERLELPDGDFIDLAWSTSGLSNDAPLVVLLHGLGGNVHSAYVSELLKAFNQAGFRGVLMHFRGASGEPNRLPRGYHSGDTRDLAYVMACLQQREPSTKKAVVGVSLGGNVLLKWLGEIGPQFYIQAAVAVSVPFLVESVVDRVNHGFSRIYQARILKRLRKMYLSKLDIINTQLPLTQHELRGIKTLKTLDDKITVPLYGFRDAKAYYDEVSSRQYLKDITTPTLIIHAKDDPFMSPQAIPTGEELSETVLLELSQNGGHVGFIAGKKLNRPVYWLSQRIPEYLKAYL